MEKIMRKTNDTSKLDHTKLENRVLADSELDASERRHQVHGWGGWARDAPRAGEDTGRTGASPGRECQIA